MRLIGRRHGRRKKTGVKTTVHKRYHKDQVKCSKRVIRTHKRKRGCSKVRIICTSCKKNQIHKNSIEAKKKDGRTCEECVFKSLMEGPMADKHLRHYLRKLSKRAGGFYHTSLWKKVRYQAILKHGRKCMCCGSTDKVEVDHIKPISKYPSLALSLDNLQILCHDCNQGKSNIDLTDFR